MTDAHKGTEEFSSFHVCLKTKHQNHTEKPTDDVITWRSFNLTAHRCPQFAQLSVLINIKAGSSLLPRPSLSPSVREDATFLSSSLQ